MAIEDDDDFDNYRLGDAERRHENDSWDIPDEKDRIPDEMATIRCHHCRKWILEDTPRCPYCKHNPLESRLNKKSLWFTITVIMVLAAIVLCWVLSRTTGPTDMLFTR